MTIIFIFALLVAFQVKHWLADYRFQTPYMLGKFKPQGWIGPLAAHAGAHALGTVSIALAALYFLGNRYAEAEPRAVGLAALDFAVHFIVDRIKVVMGRGLTTEQPRYWRQFGADQMAHHLTHYALIALLLFA